jgi:hypothetical protein
LFYSSLEEASEKINPITIKNAHDYLSSKDKSFISKEHFLKNILTSNIYQNL